MCANSHKAGSIRHLLRASIAAAAAVAATIQGRRGKALINKLMGSSLNIRPN